MAVTSDQALAQGRVAVAERPVAGLTVRLSAYLIDSLVLLGFILVFITAAGAIMLFTSDLGKEDPPDSSYYAFIALFIGGTLIGWSLFNIAMVWWRNQTPGMYMMRLRIVDDGGGRPSAGQIILRWFALHPLLFHPLLLPVWGLAALVAVSITLSDALLVASLTLVLLCLVAPLVALGSTGLDHTRRTLSDRLTHTFVYTEVA